MTPADVAAGRERVAADGFVCLPRLCDRRFLRRVLDVARQRIDAVTAALGDQAIGVGSAAGFDEIVQRSPGRWDIPITPDQFGFEVDRLPWWPLVVSVLGDGAEHSFSGIVYSDPRTPAQCWHIDSPHVAADHRDPHAVNVMVALHDVPMAMGPTEIAIGSHRLTNHHANPLLVHDELVYQNAETAPERLVDDPQHAPERRAEALAAGTCLLFDDRILHRGLANRSGETRYVAYFSARKAGYSENTHFEAQRSVFAEGVT